MARVLIPLPDKDFDTTEVAVPWRLLTQAGHEIVEVRGLNGRVGRLPRGMSAVGNQGGAEACQYRVHPALRLGINGNAFHAVLQKSRRPPCVTITVGRLF